VLAVGVEGEDGVVALGQRSFEAEAERRALALVRPLFDDRRACGACLFGGVVGRAVVDDQDREVAQCRLDDRPDPRTLVVARDQGDEAGSQRGPSGAEMSTQRVYRARPCRLSARTLSTIPTARTIELLQVRFRATTSGRKMSLTEPRRAP
jgi:hypothetical protein